MSSCVNGVPRALSFSSNSSSRPLLFRPVNQHLQSCLLSLAAALSKVATRQWSKLRLLSEFRARYWTGPYIASPPSRTSRSAVFGRSMDSTTLFHSIDIFSRNVIVDCVHSCQLLIWRRVCNVVLPTYNGIECCMVTQLGAIEFMV